jgi:hypothetical protein
LGVVQRGVETGAFGGALEARVFADSRIAQERCGLRMGDEDVVLAASLRGSFQESSLEGQSSRTFA